MIAPLTGSDKAWNWADFAIPLLARWLVAMVLVCVFAISGSPVMAQTTTTYTAPTDGVIDGTTTCTAPLVRNFVVGTSFTVADVDIGVFAEHSWRGDLQMTLQAPDGTRVQIVNGDINAISGDNFNVRLNDSATQVVNTDSATGAHSTAAPPPFANNFRPNALLSAFNGKNSLGTWRLEICDLFPSFDNGTFRHAELYLTSPASVADLSLTKTLLTATPVSGGSATFRLSVTNSASSTLTATGVQVRDILPTGFVFVSSTGSYNSATGVWTVGSVSPGATVSLDITGTVNASSGASITNTAEIIASSATDPDSTPNNGVTTEDDYASATLTVSGARTAGVPPTLLCPVGSTILFDWDLAANSWAAGSTTNSYALGSLGQIQFNMQNPGLWLTNASVGGQSPTRQNVVHGGTFENSVLQLVDLPDRSSVVTTTITLPMIMRGAQFKIFDVDFGANQFADRMEVEGRYKGAVVIPVLTNGVSNYVIGNQAYGDGASNNDQADGNITVTFNAPIDTIIVKYGNHSAAPANPGQQGISIHDINFCRPTSSITALKSSSVVSDPVTAITGGTPKAIPGATVRYCLLFTNTGDNVATNVAASDTLPANTTFVPGSLRSGTACNTASQVEDDDNAGADESDPYGAASTGTVISTLATTLAVGSSYAVTFDVTLD